MTSRKIALGLTIAVGLVASAMANAEPITTAGSLPVSIDTANGGPPSTIQLNAASQDVAAGGQYTQVITFVSGYDGAAGPISFSVDELLNASPVTISGTMDVSPTTDPDSITLAASGPFTVGDLTFTSEALTFLDSPPFPDGIVNETLTFDVANATTDVPEPASLVILGSALLGMAMVRRRRS